MDTKTRQENDDAKPGILLPALKVGVLTGTTGFITGGLIATLKANPRVGLHALGMGINSFTLGSIFWAFRNVMLDVARHNYPHIQSDTPRQRIPFSGAAGVFTGATVGRLLRGTSHVIPGAIVWGLVGTGGQWLYAIADERHTKSVLYRSTGSEEKDIGGGAFRSKWSPVKRLTEEEHKKVLEKKLLAVDADIALLDEEIENLRGSSDET